MKQSFKILLGVLLIVFMIMSIFFKIINVPKIKHSRSYDYTEKDAGGLLVLKNLLRIGFGSSEIRIVETDKLTYLEDCTEDLAILLRSKINLDTSDVKSLKIFLEQGNSVLLAAHHISLSTLLDEFEYRSSSVSDNLLSLHWEEDGLRYDISDIAKSDFFNYSSGQHFYSPTKAFTKADEYDYRQSSCGNGLAYIQDTLDVFRSYYIGNGTLYLHAMPSLLTNDATLSDIYLENFNRTFSEIPASSIVLHQWTRRNLNAGNNEDSLLKYILSQPSLKYAYYLTLLGCFIFVFFSSKRKQRPIPVKEYVKNTSLDYVHTISDVFRAQQQNEKLVPHMKKMFYNKMQRKYFLAPDLPDYAKKLSRKSKVPLQKVESLITKFEQADNYSFDDNQLIRLYTDIDSFYKSCK